MTACEMDKIQKFTAMKKYHTIEDFAQAIGAEISGGELNMEIIHVFHFRKIFQHLLRAACWL